MQRRLGISYKDAAHRLYMAEVQKLQTEREVDAGLGKLREQIDKTVSQQIYPPIMAIDEGKVEDAVAE